MSNNHHKVIGLWQFQHIVNEIVSSSPKTISVDEVSRILLNEFGLPAHSRFYDHETYKKYMDAFTCWPKDLTDRNVVVKIWAALSELAYAYFNWLSKKEAALIYSSIATADCEFCDSPQVEAPKKKCKAVKSAANPTSTSEGKQTKSVTPKKPKSAKSVTPDPKTNMTNDEADKYLGMDEIGF